MPLGRMRWVTGDGTSEGATAESSANGVSLSVRGARILYGEVGVCDESAMQNLLKHRIDGVLGGPLFEAYVVQIDYAQHVVRLFDPRNYVLSGKRDVIPVRLRGHEPFVTAIVTKRDGTALQARLLIDTGADAPLSLNRGFDKKNGLPDTTNLPTILSTGAGGTTPDLFGHIKKLTIGKSSFPEIPTFFSIGAKSRNASDPHYDGSIGNYLLVHFLVTFDYAHRQVILQPPFPHSEK